MCSEVKSDSISTDHQISGVASGRSMRQLEPGALVMLVSGYGLLRF